MVELNDDFDAGSVAPRTAMDPLPAGWYAAQFVKSELKPTKSGPNQLVLEAQILDTVHPEYANRKLWVRLNLYNSNEQAVAIARADLSAICRACGVMNLRDADALNFIPLAIKVKLREAEGNYQASNEPCGYDAIGERFGSAAPAAAPKAAAKPAAQKTAASSALPWAKK